MNYNYMRKNINEDIFDSIRNIYRTTNHKEFDISIQKYIITYELIEECFK